MQYSNEAYTKENIIEPYLSHVGHQKQINDETLNRYESLSFFEREEIAKWLKFNFSKVPMPYKTKKIGLENILTGNHQLPSALVMIRCAMKDLNF